jgi:hypothetical protein
MIRCFAIAALLTLAAAGGAAAEGTLCKDQCIKSCMGNDTPTERANCLAREKCDNRPACPAGSFTITNGMFFDPGPTPPRPITLVPKVSRIGVLTQ